MLADNCLQIVRNLLQINNHERQYYAIILDYVPPAFAIHTRIQTSFLQTWKFYGAKTQYEKLCQVLILVHSSTLLTLPCIDTYYVLMCWFDLVALQYSSNTHEGSVVCKNAHFWFHSVFLSKWCSLEADTCWCLSHNNYYKELGRGEMLVEVKCTGDVWQVRKYWKYRGYDPTQETNHRACSPSWCVLISRGSTSV